MIDLLHQGERKVVRFAIEKALEKVGADKEITEKDAEALVKVMDKILGVYWRPELADGIKKLVTDKDGKWHHYFKRMVRSCDRDILTNFILNVGYEGLYRGRKTSDKLAEENDCNIPWIILMDPTSACNMKCKGCWAAEYGYKENLSFEVMDRVLTEAEEMGVHYVMFTGGEPLVRKNDVLKLCENHPEIMFQCFTNSTLIDEAFCKEMLRVKNLIMAISIDGDEASNDERRGDGHYAKIENAMRLMKENGIPFAVSVCYTSKNYLDVTSDEFFDRLIERGAYVAWYFHYMPVGAMAVPELLPTPEQRLHMLKRLREVRAGEGGKELFCIDFQNDAEFVGGCVAGGRRYCHINAAGYVEPCVFIHYSTANVNEMSFLECMQQPLFKKYHENHPFNENHLRPCPMLENPEVLNRMVKESGAVSTDHEAPEGVDTLTTRCLPYAKNWAPSADTAWDKIQENKQAKAAVC
ncbi:MAG: radical SAM protein [Clostridia bacterium]|nr:radical SAM protein [Clostridia bacterium]